jgi:hypothetical protein
MAKLFCTRGKVATCSWRSLMSNADRLKLNMTGPGRPGREDQVCLSAIAARAEGWNYVDLLLAMLSAKWTFEPSDRV